MILNESSLEEEIIAAGMLHDILENSHITSEDIKKEFGEEISRLVLGASEKLKNREETDWTFQLILHRKEGRRD